MPEAVDTTGEILSPEQDDITPLFVRHMAAYNFFKGYVAGKKVLEIGFGEGYGTYCLADSSREITGTDISNAMVERARAKYAKGNLYFLKADAGMLPFPDNSFEVVLNSQVVEHIKDYMGFFRQMHRVLKPGGAALVATPNRKMMIDGLDPYHYKEFSAKELKRALLKVFPEVQVLGLFGSEQYMKLKTGEHSIARNVLALDFLRLRRFVLRPLVKAYVTAANARTHEMVREACDATAEDFRFSPERPEKGLDIVAICRKA